MVPVWRPALSGQLRPRRRAIWYGVACGVYEHLTGRVVLCDVMWFGVVLYYYMHAASH